MTRLTTAGERDSTHREDPLFYQYHRRDFDPHLQPAKKTKNMGNYTRDKGLNEAEDKKKAAGGG